MFDFSKLRGRIVERYGTRAAFAEAMDMSAGALSDRLNGKIFFKMDEITKAAALLGIPSEEIPVYFFTAKVR